MGISCLNLFKTHNIRNHLQQKSINCQYLQHRPPHLLRHRAPRTLDILHHAAAESGDARLPPQGSVLPQVLCLHLRRAYRRRSFLLFCADNTGPLRDSVHLEKHKEEGRGGGGGRRIKLII